MNFLDDYKVYIDDELIADITAIQFTANRESNEQDQNKVTIFYNNRILTVGLESVRFESNA